MRYSAGGRVSDLTIGVLIVLGLVMGLFVLGICLNARERADEQKKEKPAKD